MQLNFTGRNIEVTPALKSFAEEKLQRLERRDDSISKINIKFLIENVTHIAEADLHLKGTELHASAKADDMYTAIDLLVDKLLTQITKHKEKSERH